MRLSQKTAYFSFYLVLNLLVTITNKLILGGSSTRALRRPYLLTSIHALATSLGCYAIQGFVARSKHATLTKTWTARRIHVTNRQHIYLALFSSFYTLNIALSNWSLALVDLVVNHTIRATAPILTVVVSIFVLRKSITSYNFSTGLSLIPITLGVVVATSGMPISTALERNGSKSSIQQSEHDLKLLGVTITLLGAFTAVLKTILTHRLTTSLSLDLSPLELLRILSPYATFQALAFAYFNGELIGFLPNTVSTTFDNVSRNNTPWLTRDTFRYNLMEHTDTHRSLCMSVLVLWLTNAVAAFLLNIASFEANKRCGPVSMAVAANLKQVIVLAISMAVPSNATLGQDFSSRIVIGTILTVVGGIWYAWSLTQDRTAWARSTLLLASHKR